MESHYQGHLITVNNNFQANDSLSWARAACLGSAESFTVFDAQKRIILYNNRFGTFDRASPDDLLDLYSLCSYFDGEYLDWDKALKMVKQVFDFYNPREFYLQHKNGWRCHCRAWPVMDNGTLGGVILLANKVYGSKLSGGGGTCA